jgi:hypothetical protein
MTDREAFDAWWDFPTKPQGRLFTTEQHAWQAWQAATSAERERCATVCETLGTEGPVYTLYNPFHCAAAIRGTK